MSENRMQLDVMIIIEELCAAYEEEGLSEEQAPETIRVVQAVSHNKNVVVDSNGRLAEVLRKRFPKDHPLWERVTFADSEFYMKAANPIDKF